MFAMARSAAVAGMILLAAASEPLDRALHADRSQPSRPPWVAQYMEAMVGTWIADNKAYKSAQEPFEAYAIQWIWGVGHASIVGRLSGIRDGREASQLWEFREFWHPGERQLLASQFGGDGTYGVGPHHRRADGTLEMAQVFYGPDGSTRREGHRATLDGAELVTSSFDITADGTWKPRRTYVWRKTRD
jgi:hypothetical protein